VCTPPPPTLKAFAKSPKPAFAKSPKPAFAKSPKPAFAKSPKPAFAKSPKPALRQRGMWGGGDVTTETHPQGVYDRGVAGHLGGQSRLHGLSRGPGLARRKGRRLRLRAVLRGQPRGHRPGLLRNALSQGGVRG
jgi:hypothetical protein